MKPTTARTDFSIKLSDGRRLCYAEYGDQQGTPVFYFHGGGVSRLIGELAEPAASTLGVRVIVPDRPGIGLSDPKPAWKLLDWPRDVTELADHLRLERFGVFGHSAGGAYACACAYAIPDRLLGVGVVAGSPPWALWAKVPPLYRISRAFPGLGAWLFAAMTRLAMVSPEATQNRLARSMCRRDAELFARPDFKQTSNDAIRDGLRQGVSSLSHDVRAVFGDWGFQVADIPGCVHLWHGEADTVVPVAAGRALAAAILDCDARIHADEGHMSILVNYMPDILRSSSGRKVQSRQ